MEGGATVGNIGVVIKLTAFCLPLTQLHFKFKLMLILVFVNFELMVWKT